jgi:N-acetylglucosamine-6-phosphate deacetylase
MIALHNLQLISDGYITRGKAVLIEGERIIAVVDETAIPQDIISIDLHSANVAPGLIDLQVYGSGGKLFGGSFQAEALQQMENDFLAQGTTGFFATLGTNTSEVFEKAIELAKNYADNCAGNFWGLHLEGPFLNPLRKGAHSEKLIRKATLAEVQRWIEIAGGIIKMMTIAPELQDEDVIGYLNDHGVILSSGHSNASYKEGKSFLNNPVKAVTHLYNAMPPMHHRETGYIPAIFEEKPYTSIVADGIHVDFAMVRLAKRELGDKLFLITDAVTATETDIYKHQFKGDRFVMPDGTLSGSCLTMLKAVENCVNYADISLAEAVNMASLYPAQLASMHKKGKIEAGYDADLIIFDDAFEVQATVFKGNYLTKAT